MNPSQIVLCKPHPGCERFDATMANGQRVVIKKLSPDRVLRRRAEKAARKSQQYAEQIRKDEREREGPYGPGAQAGIPYLDDLMRINRDAIIDKISAAIYAEAYCREQERLSAIYGEGL